MGQMRISLNGIQAQILEKLRILIRICLKNPNPDHGQGPGPIRIPLMESEFRILSEWEFS